MKMKITKNETNRNDYIDHVVMDTVVSLSSRDRSGDLMT